MYIRKDHVENVDQMRIAMQYRSLSWFDWIPYFCWISCVCVCSIVMMLYIFVVFIIAPAEKRISRYDKSQHFPDGLR